LVVYLGLQKPAAGVGVCSFDAQMPSIDLLESQRLEQSLSSIACVGLRVASRQGYCAGMSVPVLAVAAFFLGLFHGTIIGIGVKKNRSLVSSASTGSSTLRLSPTHYFVPPQMHCQRFVTASHRNHLRIPEHHPTRRRNLVFVKVADLLTLARSCR
jgi:hypothetical protein